MEHETNPIAEALCRIEKEFGPGAIMPLGRRPAVQVRMLSTGVPALDRILGGGLPRGRIVEVFGPESAGKSTLCLSAAAAAAAQAAGGTAAYIDAEHAVDPEYASRLGVDLQSFLFSQPGSAEEALRIVSSRSWPFRTPSASSWSIPSPRSPRAPRSRAAWAKTTWACKRG